MKYVIALLLGLISFSIQAQMNEIIIAKGVDKPIKIAIVPFAWNGPRLPEDIAAIMRNDFKFWVSFMRSHLKICTQLRDRNLKCTTLQIGSA